MKQRITVEQLNELTDEQKKRLRDWWKPSGGEYILLQSGEVYIMPLVPDENLAAAYKNGGHSPLLSMGQTMELLEWFDTIQYLAVMRALYTPLRIISPENPVVDAEVEMPKLEIIDVLWDTVKQVL